MIGGKRWREIYAGFLCRAAALLVYDRRTEPFQQGRVGLAEQVQCLPQIPAVDVQHTADGAFDDIPLIIDGQIPVHRPHINEPDIVIAVPGGKSPSPAAGLTSIQNPHLLLRFNPGQFSCNFCLHFLCHVRSSSPGTAAAVFLVTIVPYPGPAEHGGSITTGN